MDFLEVYPKENDPGFLIERGFEALLKLGYRKADVKAIADEIQIEQDVLEEIYTSREEFYLDGFRSMVFKSCTEMQEKKGRSRTERKVYEAYQIILMKMQTRRLIHSIGEFYICADKKQRMKFWKILEDYADMILSIFNKAVSVQNKKQFIYCLSVIFSKNTLIMHESPSELIRGCGNTECNIMVREIKAMRDAAKKKEIFLEENERQESSLKTK